MHPDKSKILSDQDVLGWLDQGGAEPFRTFMRFINNLHLALSFAIPLAGSDNELEESAPFFNHTSVWGRTHRRCWFRPVQNTLMISI